MEWSISNPGAAVISPQPSAQPKKKKKLQAHEVDNHFAEARVRHDALLADFLASKKLEEEAFKDLKVDLQLLNPTVAETS